MPVAFMGYENKGLRCPMNRARLRPQVKLYKNP